MPKCPICGTPLEGLPFPLPDKGTGRCGVGAVYFDVEAETDKTREVVDKDGNVRHEVGWKITGDGSEHKKKTPRGDGRVRK